MPIYPTSQFSFQRILPVVLGFSKIIKEDNEQYHILTATKLSTDPDAWDLKLISSSPHLRNVILISSFPFPRGLGFFT